MRLIFMSLMLLCFYAHSQEDTASTSGLPPDNVLDAPIVPAVVYQPSYSLTQNKFVHVGPSYLRGDQYLSTKGLSLEGQYFWRESWGAQVSLSYFSSEAQDNAKTLASLGRAPIAHDPKYLLTGAMLWTPYYGKINLRQSIINYKPVFFGGVHLSHEQTSGKVQNEVATQKWLPGVNGGVGLQLPLGSQQKFSLQMSAIYFLRPRLLSSEEAWRANWQLAAMVGIRL